MLLIGLLVGRWDAMPLGGVGWAAVLRASRDSLDVVGWSAASPAAAERTPWQHPWMASRDRSAARSAVVSRTVLREQVKELLLERILAHEYAPGDRLVETRIAQELGVSQAPVREALRELETLRLVESAPFKGARVRAANDSELAEIYPIRAALEDVAARAASERLTGKVAPLEREIRRMAKAKDLHEQVEHDVRFHKLIVEASGNARLIEMWESLQVEARTMITAIRTGLDPVEVAKRHEPIVEALRRQDADAAGREIRRHVEDFGRMFLDGRGRT